MNEHDTIYHERQSLQLCLVHALNNLFQGLAYTQKTVDDICHELSPNSNFLTNPHKSWLGLGNYDVNVLMRALQLKDCAAVWFDNRKRNKVFRRCFKIHFIGNSGWYSLGTLHFNLDPHCLDLDNIVGFIVNIPSNQSLGPITVPFWKGRHWFSIRLLCGAYYNLDSKLSQPKLIGSSEDLLQYLTETVLSGDKQLIVVVGKDVETSQTYLHPPYRDLDSSS